MFETQILMTNQKNSRKIYLNVNSVSLSFMLDSNEFNQWQEIVESRDCGQEEGV